MSQFLSAKRGAARKFQVSGFRPSGFQNVPCRFPSRRQNAAVTTILLLSLSNIFMTFAWYGHLKYLHDKPLWITILIAWGIAFFEYCLMVPANRMGYGKFTGYELKIIQEVITLVVFVGFAWVVLGEKLKWNYAVSLVCLAAAVYFAFGFNRPVAPAA